MATTQKPRPTSSTAQDTPRAAVYARVSDDKTGEENSVSQQQEAALDLIDRRGWISAGVYVDNSITGTGKKHRPQFYAMLEAVKRGEIDAIVARHMDRLARNPRERLTLVEACRENGVIIALVQGTDMDPTNASGRMVIGVLGEMAEMEIALKSERHVAALHRHAKSGKAPHGPAPLGYTTSGEIVPDEAVLVRRIFDGFAGGESLRSLARSLTADGVLTRSTIMAKRKLDKLAADPEATDKARMAAQAAYDKAAATPWATRTVRDILTNPRYAGWAIYQAEIMFDDDGNPVRGQWDALVDADAFDVIQARLADPGRKTNTLGTHRRYLGSALFVCDECGEPVETLNGGRYTCRSGKHPVGLMREHGPVDMFVVDAIAERLGRPDFASVLAPDSETVKPFTDAARRLRARLEVADNDYANGDIDAKLLKKTKAAITAELAGIESRLVGMTSGAALGNLAASADPAASFRAASVMGQRAAIAALCEVRLRRTVRGRPAKGRYFDTTSVVINWKN